MSITDYGQNTIYLGGGGIPGGEGGLNRQNELVAYSAIYPGMLVEVYNDSGTPKLRPHATANGTFARKLIALEQLLLNKTITDAYAAGDLVEVADMYPGSLFLGIIPSGQTVVPGDALSSNGDGKFRVSTTAPVARARASSNGAVTVDTFLKMEAL